MISRLIMNRSFKTLVILAAIVTLFLFLINSRSKTHSQLKTLKTILADRSEAVRNISNIPNNKPPVIHKHEPAAAALAAPAEVEKKSGAWFSSGPVIVWIDLPNVFPWRHCLSHSGGIITTSSCTPGTQSSTFQIVSQEYEDKEEAGVEVERFILKVSASKCVVVSAEDKISISGECEDAGHWEWTHQGQLRWSRQDCVHCRKCVTGKKAGQPVTMSFCVQHSEDQNLELGHWVEGQLTPWNITEWQQRQDTMRTAMMEEQRPLVTRVLAEVDMNTALHQFDQRDESRKRRGAVFYVDKGSSGITMLNWWIFTWRFIGLDKPDQGFDLIMMTHPAMVKQLPHDCVLVTDDFKISYNSSGQCLYKPYLGISYRDKAYDGYMNSQECLYGPGSEFLSQYDLLLRADLDTFPTPHMLDYWPQGVVVDIQYSTNHGLENIKQALRELACSVGIQHQEWFNMGSTWYGDGRRVRDLAKLTVALNKFGRAQMFGPGTRCRCYNCTKLPRDCEWGGGPYAGTLLLYLQEIALNKILTQSEWDNMPKGQLDQGVTDFKRNVCEPVVLHCFHNGELFSKNAFMAGHYKDLDLSEMDMTNERDYAAYMALVSSGQGKNSEMMKTRLEQSLGGGSWQEYCKPRIKS